MVTAEKVILWCKKKKKGGIFLRISCYRLSPPFILDSRTHASHAAHQL